MAYKQIFGVLSGFEAPKTIGNYLCVIQNATTGILEVATTGIHILGVVQSGKGVQKYGVAKVLAEGVIPFGSPVKVGAAGGVVVAAATEKAIGLAAEAATAANAVISVVVENFTV